MKATSGPKVRCTKCGDILQSMNRHDFKWCKCKTIAVDGGGEYLKLTGNPGDWEVLKNDR